MSAKKEYREIPGMIFAISASFTTDTRIPTMKTSIMPQGCMLLKEPQYPGQSFG